MIGDENGGDNGDDDSGNDDNGNDDDNSSSTDDHSSESKEEEMKLLTGSDETTLMTGTPLTMKKIPTSSLVMIR
jgi:hypothetical protein